MRTLSKRKSDELKNMQLKKAWEPDPLYWAILPQRNSLFSISLHSAEKRLTVSANDIVYISWTLKRPYLLAS